MAKSKATYNKKEKEKQKQRKRKEKEERKEERKANSSKNKSFDDMIAYVDENGRITSTPPDISVKSNVKTEDIQISIPKREKRSADERRTGVVNYYNDEKGFGFIQEPSSNERIFFHASGLVDEVKENDQVSFKTEQTHRGITAIDVRK